MTRIVSSQKGWSLLEIIVVLAVLGALAAIIAPVVFRYIDDANEQRALADVNTIAAAINKMYTDTGRWPFYEDGDGPLAHTDMTDADLLTSNATCTAGTCTDATLPVDGTTGDTWGLAGVVDNLENQLVTNTPFGDTSAAKDYPTTGERPWHGPYLDRVSSLDPWGKSYLVNIGNADPSVAAASQNWVIVISSGPDGTLQTDATSALASAARATGDDIIARVR